MFVVYIDGQIVSAFATRQDFETSFLEMENQELVGFMSKTQSREG